MRLTFFTFLAFIIISCSDQDSEANLESPSCMVDAEILGIDYTYHACGGGYIIRTSDDQFAAFELNDQDLEDEAFQLTIYDDPIKVLVAFEDKAENERCSFFSKNITCITRKN